MTMLYSSSVADKPNAETVWLPPQRVTLSERISSRGEWSSILAKLG